MAGSRAYAGEVFHASACSAGWNHCIHDAVIAGDPVSNLQGADDNFHTTCESVCSTVKE